MVTDIAKSLLLHIMNCHNLMVKGANFQGEFFQPFNGDFFKIFTRSKISLHFNNTKLMEINRFNTFLFFTFRYAKIFQ